MISHTDRINIANMAISPKAIYRFSEFPLKFQHNYFQTLKEQCSTLMEEKLRIYKQYCIIKELQEVSPSLISSSLAL